MKALKILSTVLAFVPSLIVYVVCFVVASSYHAAREGWGDGS